MRSLKHKTLMIPKYHVHRIKLDLMDKIFHLL